MYGVQTTDLRGGKWPNLYGDGAISDASSEAENIAEM